MKDIENKEDIKLLVDSFYGKVMKNDILSPIFKDVIKDWNLHLPRMYSFWGTLLISEMSYHGSPYAVHQNLPIDKKHFDEWVMLFNSTVDENFEGEVANQAKNFAKTNGHIFESKLRMSK
jgi:hemoglobin